MAFTDLRAVMRANLPEPPARVLEVGAGAGRLARALRAVGYDVLEPESDDVRAVALADLDEPAGSFAAAIARRLAPPLDPLDDSCRRLGELVEPGGTLLLEEFAVGALTPLTLRGGSSSAARARRTAAADRRGARRGAPLAPAPVRADPRGTPAALRLGLGPPLRGAWLHRWDLGESLRAVEEEAIARGHLRALAGSPASLRL
jgi:Methyltransferase domain